MRKTFWLLILIFAVLAGTTWLLDARADDTYNFYFQKAPGPVTVNQGAAPAAGAKPDVQVKGEAVTTAPLTATQGAIAAANEPVASTRNWELSLGFGSLRSIVSSGYGGSSWSESGTIRSNQYRVGLAYNLNDYFATEAEAFTLTSRPDRTIAGLHQAGTGSLFDYGGSLVVTPFRLPMGSHTKLALAGLVGGVTVPVEKSPAPLPVAQNPPWEIGHQGSFVYGARASIELNSKLAFQAAYRKLSTRSYNQAIASIAFLL